MSKASVCTTKEDSNDSSFIMLPVHCAIQPLVNLSGAWWFQSVWSNQRPVRLPGPPMHGYHWFNMIA